MCDTNMKQIYAICIELLSCGLYQNLGLGIPVGGAYVSATLEPRLGIWTKLLSCGM
jgi:hypothetical protein